MKGKQMNFIVRTIAMCFKSNYVVEVETSDHNKNKNKSYM